MSALEVNKIIASIIVAVIVIGLIAIIGDLIFKNSNDEVVQNAYKIDIAEVQSDENSTNTENIDSSELVSPLLKTASLENGEKIFKKCGACHTYKKDGANKVGPNLWNVLNREMGQVDGYKYSKALMAFGGKWDYSSLNQFLLKPKEYMKGTKMNYAGLKKEKDRANILLWLRSLADTPANLPSDEEIQKEKEGMGS